MAIANFFDKIAFGASQILQQFSVKEFEKLLLSHNIKINFSKKTALNKEGKILLELLARLLSRLYPNLEFNCIDDQNNQYGEELVSICKSINPAINFTTKDATIEVNVGAMDSYESPAQKFYLGSDEWLGSLSQSKPLTCNDSNNPFGAGFAACIGAANVFRTVFKKQLPFTELDQQIVFSVFDYSINESSNQGPRLHNIHFNDTILVGLGAIGNAVIWTLNHLDLSGGLTLVDHEIIEISNLQRYIITSQKDIGKYKVDIAKKYLSKKINIDTHCIDWQEYLKSRQNWKMHIVGVAVDSAQARILIQSSLPRKVINSWTQMEQLGISRHYDFTKDACLACLYLPTSPRKSLSEEIAENLNLVPFERTVIRQYLAEKKPIDDQLLQLVSQYNKIAIEEISFYKGALLEKFHSEVVCGGILMKLTGSTVKTELVHVPSAFESVLAGIFLASELVIDAENLMREKIPNITKLNLMRPITKYTTESAAKHASKKCICQDIFFMNAYKQKYNV